MCEGGGPCSVCFTWLTFVVRCFVCPQIEDFSCFSPQAAGRCAERSVLTLDGGDVEDMPFNIEGEEVAAVSPLRKSHQETSPTPCVKSSDSAVTVGTTEGKAYVSSNSTVVTNTSASSSCGRGVCGAGAGLGGVPKPPLEVVRTDSAVHSEDELGGGEQKKPTSATSPKMSSSFTDKLVKDQQSRQGRSLQRWLVHSKTEDLVRQVAGSIPITKDGRIILISASRKTEWILPKGGWDADETKEECAVRETYEEGGLLGSLGSCLDPIDYESSKAKKRRLGMSAVKSKRKSEMLPPLPKRVKVEASAGVVSAVSSSGTTDASSPDKETMSTPASSPDPTNYSYVRLFLFPLYVTTVKTDWPEKGRLRKVVSIDEAIRIMELEDRPYFRRALEMVKARGLHLINGDNVVPSSKGIDDASC